MVTRPQVHVFLSGYLSFYALIIMGHHRAMFRALKQPEAGLEKPSTEQQLSNNSFAVVGEGGVFSKHSKFQGMVKNFSCSNITCSHWIGWQGMLHLSCGLHKVHGRNKYNFKPLQMDNISHCAQTMDVIQYMSCYVSF